MEQLTPPPVLMLNHNVVFVVFAVLGAIVGRRHELWMSLLRMTMTSMVAAVQFEQRHAA